MLQDLKKFEWPTVLLLVLAYGVFGVSVVWVYDIAPILAFGLMALAGTLHSSLSHEVLHGHPFRSEFLNALLVFPALTIFVPYLRFKDTHLAHHFDERLTDPYDDPESNFLDPKVWNTLPVVLKAIYRVNNTLAGRMLVGPLLSQIVFVRGDVKHILNGNRRILLAWAIHVSAVACVYGFISTYSQMPIGVWIIASYAALSVLKIRTFLEHQAHEKPRGRTVIIADRGPLAWLFLNNNYHIVHHIHPKVAWYRLPNLFAKNRDTYLQRNCGYYFDGYIQIFQRFLLRAKDPVAHPLWTKRGD